MTSMGEMTDPGVYHKLYTEHCTLYVLLQYVPGYYHTYRTGLQKCTCFKYFSICTLPPIPTPQAKKGKVSPERE